MTARTFNPLMAMAADLVIAESQEVVPVGVIAPDDVMTPAVLVDRLVAKEGAESVRHLHPRLMRWRRAMSASTVARIRSPCTARSQ